MSRSGRTGGEAKCAGVKGSDTTVETGHPSTRTLKKSAEIFEPAVQGRVWARSRQPDLYVEGVLQSRCHHPRSVWASWPFGKQ